MGDVELLRDGWEYRPSYSHELDDWGSPLGFNERHGVPSRAVLGAELKPPRVYRERSSSRSRFAPSAEKELVDIEDDGEMVHYTTRKGKPRSIPRRVGSRDVVGVGVHKDSRGSQVYYCHVRCSKCGSLNWQCVSQWSKELRPNCQCERAAPETPLVSAGARKDRLQRELEERALRVAVRGLAR